MKKSNQILWGIALIAVGILIALNSLDIIDINLFFKGWWTLFIIVPCAIGLFSGNEKFGNLLGILLGVLLLLCCRDIISFGLLWKLFIPFVIVIIGLKMIFGSFHQGRCQTISKNLEAEGKQPKNVFAIFSGQNTTFNKEAFNGAELNAIFGAIKCDLTQAVIEQDCVINASAIFGGIDIIVPENVNIKIHSNSIFGGISNKKPQNSDHNTVTVYVNGTAMFGGITIQ